MNSAPGTSNYCKSCIRIEHAMDKVIAMPTIFESTDPALDPLAKDTDEDSEGELKNKSRTPTVMRPQDTSQCPWIFCSKNKMNLTYLT
jgi:hypothetical protein